MGGYAHVIPVKPKDSLIEAAKRPRPSRLRRLFGFTTNQPSWEEWDEHRAELSIPGLGDSLVSGFRKFIKRTITHPWPSTTSFLEYLWMKHNVYVRGYRETEGSPHCYSVELHFSGCGGMADVSSEVAAHWADIWYRSERTRVESDCLRPHGLDPDGGPAEPAPSWSLFLPAGEWGYAAIAREESFHEFLESMTGEEEPFRFGIDEAAREVDEEKASAVLRLLEVRGIAVMKDRRCRCQLCMPEFDPSHLGLPKFR